ncbi:MAG: hypothetical protein Q7J54_06285 [Candidatus Woesearchaeota archaeon]|nr:hypothetical protein [Candidatus Woesearchaeota archaeon]
MKKEKPEVMVVDDEGDWLVTMDDLLSPLGYRIATASNSYDAIDQIAIRIHKKEDLPDIYLCDMLDKNNVIAKRIIRSYPKEFDDIYATIAFNLYNYLRFKGAKPNFFVANTSSVSAEDIEVAESLAIPLITRVGKGWDDFFPDITGLTREDALKKYAENYSQMLKRYKRE